MRYFLLFIFTLFISSGCKTDIKSANESSDTPIMIIKEPLATELRNAILQEKPNEVKQLLIDSQIDLKSLKKDIQFELLDMATRQGYFDLVKYLSEQGIDINVHKESGQTALHSAAWRGKADIVHYLIDNGADVNAIYKAGGNITPLCCAAEYGDLEIVKYLIKHGADIQYKGESSGASPIKSAANRGRLEVFKYLAEQLPEDFDWQLSLVHVIIGGNMELVKYVVENKGADVNKESSSWGYPIHMAISHYSFTDNSIEIMEYLLSKGARLEDINNGEIFPWAWYALDEDKIIFLLEKGVKYVPDNSEKSWDPLPGALDRGQFKLAQHLLKTEMDYNFRDMPLVEFFADGRFDSPNIIRFLIRNGINKKYYPQAFLRSAEYGNLESVKLLFETGRVDINVSTDNGYNAIALTESGEVASYLIEKGINTNNKKIRENAVSNFGVLEALGEAGIKLNMPVEKMNETLIRAARMGNEWVVEHMLKRGADPNHKTVVERFFRENGRNVEIETTPLVENALWGYEEFSHSGEFISIHIIKLLLKYGAGINTTDQKGKTALHYASGGQNHKGYLMGSSDLESRIGREMGAHSEITSIPPRKDSIIVALIEGGADLNIQDNDGNTPLMLAAIYDNSFGMQMLLKHGAKIGLKNKKGKTFFDLIYGENIVIALLETDLKDSIPKGVLNRVFLNLCMAYYYDTKRINIILDNGANINCFNEKNGTYALHYIVEHGPESKAFYEVVYLLLDRGFDINMTGEKNGKTVLQIATDKGRSEELIKILLSYGAELNTQEEHKRDSSFLQSLIDLFR